MMKRLFLIGIVAFCGGAYAVEPTIDDLVKTPDEIVFQPIAEFDGLEAAFIAGNPGEEGPYVFRAKFRSGILSEPHFHDQTRHITVLEGTWYFGLGSNGDCAGTKPIKVGGAAVHPKGIVHYDGACAGEAIVEITGIGPVKTTFVKAVE